MPTRRSLPISLLALLAMAGTAAAPGGLVGGFGTAATFFVDGAGLGVEDVFYDWTYACADCYITMTLTDFTALYAGAGAQTLAPGAYEVRELKGVFARSWTAPHEYEILIWGHAKIERVG